MNPYSNAAVDFSKAYRDQVAASQMQRRSSLFSDETFAGDESEEAASLVGEPTPETPIAPDERLDGVPNGTAGDMDDNFGNIFARAKRRSAEYLKTRS